MTEPEEFDERIADLLHRRDQRMAQAGFDAAVRWYRERGLLLTGPAAKFKTVVRDEQGRITGILEQPAVITPAGDSDG